MVSVGKVDTESKPLLPMTKPARSPFCPVPFSFARTDTVPATATVWLMVAKSLVLADVRLPRLDTLQRAQVRSLSKLAADDVM